MSPARPPSRWSRELSASFAGFACAGAFAGVLVGAAAARMNSSLSEPSDARSFLFLLACIYASVFAIGGLAAGAIARVLAPREEPPAESWLAVAVGRLLAALAGFAAFALAQRGIATFNWRSDANPQNAFASIAIGLVVASLFARFVSRPSLAALLRGVRALVPVLVLIAIAALVFTAGSPATSAASPSSVPRVAIPADQRPAQRVILIGVDGADWSRIDPLLAAGKLPNLERLIAHGTRSPLATRLPTWSPILWNTISTGRTEDEHGVLDFTELELPLVERGLQRSYRRGNVEPILPRDVGLTALALCARERRWVRELPITAFHRRVKALWNVLSDQGLQVGVVRWFASWPAEEVRGWLVSDNDPWAQAFAAEKSAEAHVESAGFTWPPELAAELSSVIDDVVAHERPPADGGAEPDLLAHPLLADLTDAERVELRRMHDDLVTFGVIVHGDRFAAETAAKLWREKHPDFLAVYLRAVDNLSHRLWKYTGVIDRTYEWTDARIGELVANAGEGTAIVIVSDHGWIYTPGPRFSHVDGPDGIAIVSGAGARAGGAGATKPSILDVAPTVLALFGLPASEEMPGSAWLDALAPDAQTAATRPRVRSFGPHRPHWSALPTVSDGREHGVELLKNLGYVDSGKDSKDSKASRK